MKVKDGRDSAAGLLLDRIQCCIAFSSHCGSAPEQNRIRWVVWHRCFQFFRVHFLSNHSTSLLPLTHEEITDVTHSTVSAGAQAHYFNQVAISGGEQALHTLRHLTGPIFSQFMNHSSTAIQRQDALFRLIPLCFSNFPHPDYLKKEINKEITFLVLPLLPETLEASCRIIH